MSAGFDCPADDVMMAAFSFLHVDSPDEPAFLIIARSDGRALVAPSPRAHAVRDHEIAYGRGPRGRGDDQARSRPSATPRVDARRVGRCDRSAFGQKRPRSHVRLRSERNVEARQNAGEERADQAAQKIDRRGTGDIRRSLKLG